MSDSENIRIQVFDSHGRFIREWSALGDKGLRVSLSGLAIGGDGNVYLSDGFNHRIQVFDSRGRFICDWGSYMGGSLAIGGGGKVYVGNFMYHRIEVFERLRRLQNL